MTQLDVPLGTASQLTPQPPQFPESEVMSVSQPLSAELAGGDEQSAWSLSQVGWQAAATHDAAEAPAIEQALPQAPQFALSSLTFVSQPSSADEPSGLEQLAKPEAQLEVHAPLVHVAEATLVVEHARPQAPQWLTEFWMFVSQPSSAPVVGRLQLPQPD